MTYELSFVTVDHCNKGTFFCHSGSLWQFPIFLRKKERKKIQNIGVAPEKRDKNPKKYVQYKKKIPALENLVSCTLGQY